MPSISVVIPNYNGKHLLEKNLPYVFKALKKSGQDFEAIISDDCSTDNSIQFLEDVYPEIKLIKNQVNVGFSTNINLGLSSATKDLVLALNSDVKLEEDYFLSQLKYFTDPKVFGVMGRICDFDSDHIQDGAKWPEMKLSTLRSTGNYLLSKPSSETAEVFTLFLSGANSLMNREKLQFLGGFNTYFSPFYGEDVELSLRAWRLGWKCLYDHESICRHEVSSTIASYNKLAYIKLISMRNKFALHYIHLTGIHRLLWYCEVSINLLSRWLALQSSYYNAFFHFLKSIKNYKLSKTTFKESQAKVGINLSVLNIVKKIKRHIGNKTITHF